MAVRNIKLTIRYDGRDYHGWQAQPGEKTIQGTIENALAQLLGDKVKLTGTSRTDAGVSALAQTANIRIDSPVPTENLARAITQKLPEDIAVTQAEEVDQTFDPITSVKSKLYRYTICTDVNRPVLQIRHCWHRPGRLDIKAMDAAAKCLVDTYDFKSFASAADNRQSSVRTILLCDVSSKDNWIYIDVEADGFLYNMVRNIVGTLAEVGRGRWRPEKIKEILAAKDRTAAGPIAPACGLCLMWIKY